MTTAPCLVQQEGEPDFGTYSAQTPANGQARLDAAGQNKIGPSPRFRW